LAPPYTDLADGASTRTPILDVLVKCDELGIRLRNDGAAVDFATAGDWRRAPADLRRAVRQVRHTMATMLPKGAVTP
jgi:hypothetical protein